MDTSTNPRTNQNEKYIIDEDEDSIDGPIVFSCPKCMTIVGDTFAYVASIPERNLFGLQAVPDSVVVEDLRKMSNDPDDNGSVYADLKCAKCKELVGRYYITTHKDLDPVRNTYALDISRVTTYELGKCMRGERLDITKPLPEFYTSIAFKDDISMVKGNITAIAARLQRLEQSLTMLSPTTAQSYVGTGRRKPPSSVTGSLSYHQTDLSKNFS